ncbi:hypothetical protein K438DRAFT_2127562 [Mycena galopus ATCC 62051]|nr:hypothetical protein K438DRAFT_2127562 [Mycena galopus ATCC 62051]
MSRRRTVVKISGCGQKDYVSFKIEERDRLTTFNATFLSRQTTSSRAQKVGPKLRGSTLGFTGGGVGGDGKRKEEIGDLIRLHSHFDLFLPAATASASCQCTIGSNWPLPQESLQILAVVSECAYTFHPLAMPVVSSTTPRLGDSGGNYFVKTRVSHRDAPSYLPCSANCNIQLVVGDSTRTRQFLSILIIDDLWLLLLLSELIFHSADLKRMSRGGQSATTRVYGWAVSVAQKKRARLWAPVIEANLNERILFLMLVLSTRVYDKPRRTTERPKNTLQLLDLFRYQLHQNYSLRGWGNQTNLRSDLAVALWTITANGGTEGGNEKIAVLSNFRFSRPIHSYLHEFCTD